MFKVKLTKFRTVRLWIVGLAWYKRKRPWDMGSLTLALGHWRLGIRYGVFYLPAMPGEYSHMPGWEKHGRGRR